MMEAGINMRAGPMCRTVADVARVLDAIAGYDPKDEFTVFGVGRRPAQGHAAAASARRLDGLRIGVIREYVNKSLFGKADEQSIDLAEREQRLELVSPTGARRLRGRQPRPAHCRQALGHRARLHWPPRPSPADESTRPWHFGAEPSVSGRSQPGALLGARAGGADDADAHDLDAGLAVSSGTDAPVIPYPPLWTLYHFVTRDTITRGRFRRRAEDPAY